MWGSDAHVACIESCACDVRELRTHLCTLYPVSQTLVGNPRWTHTKHKTVYGINETSLNFSGWLDLVKALPDMLGLTSVMMHLALGGARLEWLPVTYQNVPSQQVNVDMYVLKYVYDAVDKLLFGEQNT